MEMVCNAVFWRRVFSFRSVAVLSYSSETTASGLWGDRDAPHPVNVFFIKPEACFKTLWVLGQDLMRPSKPFSLAWRSIVGLRTGISSTPQSTNISARQDTRLKTQMSRSWIRKYAGMNVEWRKAFTNVSRSRLSLRSSASTSRTYGTRRSARFLATSQMPNNQANHNKHIQAISKLMVILQSEEVRAHAS